MRTRFLSLVAVLGLTAGAAQAADKFECPAVGGQDAPQLSADLARLINLLDADSRAAKIPLAHM